MKPEDICPSDKIVLHIGYHKTATTWFQSELFSRSDLGFEVLSARNLVHGALCIPHPLVDGANSSVRQIVLEAQQATARGNYFVVSHERLSGYPASGGFDSRLIADRLKLYFPNARVFCLFREQREMILSAWRQQVVDGGGLSLSRFINPPQPQIRRMPLFDPAMYCYSRLLEYYRALFGADNVLFHPYEVFCQQPQATLAALAILLENRKLQEFANGSVEGNKKPNLSLSMPVLHLQRFMNVYFARTQLSANCIVDLGATPIRVGARAIDRAIGRSVLRPIDVYLRRRAMKRIAMQFEDCFGEDNTRLAGMIKLHLANFGYAAADKGQQPVGPDNR